VTNGETFFKTIFFLTMATNNDITTLPPACVSALECAEIYALYESKPQRPVFSFCPMTKTQAKLAKMNFYSCPCDLCTVERITKKQEEMIRKILKTVELRNNKCYKVGSVGMREMDAIAYASKKFAFSPQDMLDTFCELYLRAAKRLLKEPFVPIFDSYGDDSVYLQSPSFVKMLEREIRTVQPRCYQIFALERERKILQHGKIRNEKEYLVGIEPNPGPEMLIRYLKNMEKMDECVSTRKRLTSVSKVLTSLEKKRQKQKDIEIKKKRNTKLEIRAQGLFDGFMKMDESTKNFIENVCDRFISQTKEIQITHKVQFDFFDKFEAVFEYFSGISETVKNMFISFCKLVAYFVNPAILSALEMFTFEQFHDAQEQVVPQMELPLQAFLMAIYTKHLCGIVLEGDWANFSSRLFQIKNEAGKTKTTFEIVKAVLHEVADFLYETAGVKIPLLYKEDELMNDLQFEAKMIWKQYTSGAIDDYNFAERVSVFTNEIENLLYERRKTVTPEQKEKLQYLLKKFTPVMQYCTRYVNPNNGPRIEPLAILIGGPTGVGKSTFTVPFLLALMSRILPEEKKKQFFENHNDFLFFRANENEFWDGYKMRNVAIVYDDFGQMKDSVGAPSADAFEIIRLKNTAPYHLHFAAIEDKQRNYAVPKIIFATTNLHKLQFEGITCSEAVARRFDCGYIQVPKLEFSKNTQGIFWERRLDIEKVRAVYPEVTDDPSSFVALEVAEFIPWDFSTGKQIENAKVLGFWELLDLCEKKFHEVNSKGDKMLQFHKFLKENPRIVPQMNFPDFSQVLGNMKESIQQISEGKLKFLGKIDLNDKAKAALIAFSTVAASLVAFSFAFGSSDTLKQGSYEKIEVRKDNIQRHQKTRGRFVPRTNKAASKVQGAVVVQSGDTKMSPYLKLLKRNMYKISDMDGTKDYGWATFVFDRTFIIPRHFLLVLDSVASQCSDEETVPVCFKNPFTGIKNIVIDWKRDLELYDYCHEEKYDYVFLTISESKCRLHANITDMFVDDSSLRDGDRFKANLVVQRDDMNLFFSPDVKISLNDKYEYESGVVDENHKPILVSSRIISYAAPTEIGDCGSILLSMDSRFARPTILGIHTAALSNSGRTRLAIGSTVFKQHVQLLKSQLKPFFQEEKLEVDDSKMERFNALRLAEQPRIPDKTKIEKSDLCDELWETTTQPAHLKTFTSSQGEKINPALKARAGYAHDEVLVDSEILDHVVDLVSNSVLQKNMPVPWEPRVFSFEEAVSGVDGVDFVDAINRSSSPGYPYVLNNKAKGKSFWFGSEGKIDFSSPEALQVRGKVVQIISSAACGVRHENIYVDYLKDERRPIAKVDLGKTRQFMACGMDYLIAVKMYFGDYIRHICQNRIANGVAVGINPYEEWDTLAQHLLGGREKEVTAGDYKGYDGKIPVPVGYGVLKTVEDFYYNSTDNDRKIRSVLFLDIVNSLHLSEGKVYEFVGGNPSGQPFTSIFNSVANLIMLSYLGCVNALESGSSPAEFDQVYMRTRMSVFGDDNIIAYLPIDRHIFGQQALEKNAVRLLGMDYTDEAKSGKIFEFRRLHEVSFLKRGFRPEPSGYTCPLDLQVLKETLQWQKNNSTIGEMKLRIECVCAEFSRHGKEVFDEHVPLIARASVKKYDYMPFNANYHKARASGDSLAI
jgi:hypothetical protein